MDEHWCYQALRRHRWPNGPTCVDCGSARITVHTRSRRTPRFRYLCLACRRTFTDLTGTIFARSNLPLRTWFVGLSVLSEQLSTVEYARALSVKWETAYRMSSLLTGAFRKGGLVSDLHRVLDEVTHWADTRSAGDTP